MKLSSLVIFATLAHATIAKEPVVYKRGKQARMFPIFQVVKFPNDICESSTRNGTCYTSEECSSRGGMNQGSCADGYGVCCIFELRCGSTSRENCTYLVQTTTTDSMACSYSICPCSKDICRIRYDFTTFVINPQSTGTVVAAGAGAVDNVDAVGDCTVDAFSITSPGLVGSPVICGTNTGYHMVLDVANANACQTAHFDINAAAGGDARSWDIKVTQYGCGNEDRGGPPGCLQYFTGTSGTIANYGFPPTITTIADTVTHLQNQNYEYCFRRESGFCSICYSRSNGPNAAAGASGMQHSFGLSVSTDAAVKSGVGTNCIADYITIPGGTTAAIAAMTTTAHGATRFCGRVLANVDGAELDLASTTAAIQVLEQTVCSRSTPFRLGFFSDSQEVATGTTAILNERTVFPGGIIGFRLNWFQRAC